MLIAVQALNNEAHDLDMPGTSVKCRMCRSCLFYSSDVGCNNPLLEMALFAVSITDHYIWLAVLLDQAVPFSGEREPQLDSNPARRPAAITAAARHR